MSALKIAVVITNPSNEQEFVLVKQTPPPRLGEEEYDSYTDSDLWDLPSAHLTPIDTEFDKQSKTTTTVRAEGELHHIDLTNFNLPYALDQVFQQVGFGTQSDFNWKLIKCVEEPAFDPGLPISTVFITGKLSQEKGDSGGLWKWMSIQSCLNYLLEAKPCSNRIGLLAVVGLINDSVQSTEFQLPPALNFQEYPPGVKIVPMSSRTGKPFRTTNLVVFAPDTVSQSSTQKDSSVCHGDALMVDPGCWYEDHEKLKEIIASLPRKLIVFVTHHHRDHVDGLSVVQKSNPDVIVVAHENTMSRIRKEHKGLMETMYHACKLYEQKQVCEWDIWSEIIYSFQDYLSLSYTPVSGGEELCIGGQQLRVIFAPGHTDGHMGLLHLNTHSLILGDHCVGQGSAVLDITSGGNMHEYFQTTYRFMEISPHVIVPMHGRLNLWPKHMLCSYLKNRRARESTILKAIESGAATLFDIVAYTYADVDRYYWYIAASNVRLHVDHLAEQGKLPKGFSIQKFVKSCGLCFKSRWLWSYLSSRYLKPKLRTPILISAIAVVSFAVLYSAK